MALSKPFALLVAAASLVAVPRAFASYPTLTNATLSTNAATGPWFLTPYISSTNFNSQITAQDVSTGVYISSISANGLIVLWHFDEGSGTTAFDYSGQHDTGTLSNAPTWTTGVFGGALQFNGTNQGVYGSTVFNTEPNTVNEECWFKTTTTTGGKLLSYENTQTGTAANDYDANLYMANSGQVLYGNYNSQAGVVQTVSSPLSYNDGNWHHVVAQTSPTTGESLYVDGVLVAQNTAYNVVQQFGSAYWRVGSGNLQYWTSAPSSYYFNGTIDEVRVSTVVMTSLQVAKDYEAGLASLAGNGTNTINNSAGLLVSTGAPTGLYLQWHLDEFGGSIALDASGNGNTGTKVGNPTLTSGEFGEGLTLNGSSQYLYSPLLPTFPFVLTEELWFKTTQTSGTEDLIDLNHSQTLTAGSTDRLVRINASGQVGFYVFNGGVGYSILSSQSYNDGNWHHVAATLSSTFGIQLYVDGNLVAANSSVTSADNYSDGGPYLIVGRGSEGYFNGTIDEVRFSTVARNSLQIALDYLDDTLASQNSGKPFEVMYSSNSGASWAFLGASSTTMTGANGTITAQTLQSNALSVPPYGSGTTNQVTTVAQNRGGQVTVNIYTVIVDTTQPTAPTVASLSNPTLTSLQANGVTGSTQPLSGLAAAPYDVQWSTSTSFGIIAADSGWVTGPTAVGTGLLFPNTTYYVRAHAVSEDGVVGPFSSVFPSLSTLANPVSIPSGAPVLITSTTFTETWTALPSSPPPSTCEGYELDLSTTNFAAGTVIYTTTTPSNLANTLSIAGLNPSTTVYIRVGTINWNGALNYVALSSANIQISQNVATIIMGLDTNLQLSTVSANSVGITNLGNLPITLVLTGSDVTSSSPWSLAASSGVETAVLQGEWNSIQPTSGSFNTAITAAPVNSSAVNYIGNQTGHALAPGATGTMYFKFSAPTSTTQLGAPHVLQVIYQSNYP
jgi:hypothetical protein